MERFDILCDFGQLGQAFAERNVNATNRKSTVDDIVGGQVEYVIAVHAIDVSEGWAIDATDQIAAECAKRVLGMQQRHGADALCLPRGLRDFIETHCGENALMPVDRAPTRVERMTHKEFVEAAE